MVEMKTSHVTKKQPMLRPLLVGWSYKGLHAITFKVVVVVENFWAFAITFGASHVLRARQLVPESSLQSDFAADIIIAMFFLLLPLLLISSQCSFSPFHNHKDYNCTTLIHP